MNRNEIGFDEANPGNSTGFKIWIGTKTDLAAQEATWIQIE
jgi:hypothetical protein